MSAGHMKDVMVDLETMASCPRAAIISIGAVVFDPIDGRRTSPENSFYRNVSLESSCRYGLELSPSTILWWMKQSQAARDVLFDNTIELPQMLQEFAAYVPQGCRIWGNGATFDNAILRYAYERCGIPVPWHYRDDRDVRTLVALGKAKGYTKYLPQRQGVAHNALDDALHQVEYCTQIYQYLLRKDA